MKSQILLSTRKFYSILPIALVSVLILGTARLAFDNLKNSNTSTARYVWKFLLQRRSYGHTLSAIREDEDDDDQDIEDCNVFEGKWVWDNVSHPLYSEESCPYLVKQVACQRNGRPDNFYQNWRWQPHECNLPRFNALKLLKILKNKRLMFVGDSIQRGQYDSMVCMLQSVIPDERKLHYKVPPRKIFFSKDYNATVEFYWAPFLLESNSDHTRNHSVHTRLVKLDRISNHSKNWEGVDFLVFESYVWWMYSPLINATKGSSDEIREYNVTTAYKSALYTWAKWIDSSINPDKQKVFFMSLSPTHLWSWEWHPGSDGNCFGETLPLQPPFQGAGTSTDVLNIVQDTLEKMKVDVTLLNITQLSDYRRDAHTTVYTERRGKLLTKEQRADPKNFADCIHWCLPGVPDTWNEILYAHLLSY